LEEYIWLEIEYLLHEQYLFPVVLHFIQIRWEHFVLLTLVTLLNTGLKMFNSYN